jgi:hypothetical protein
MFLSGTFTVAAERWAIIEKEAFALVETVKRADYMLHRPGVIHLFTDHKKNVWAELLSRWGTSEPGICAIKLVQFRTSSHLDQAFQWPGK